MTNPFEELAALINRRMDRFEAQLSEKDKRKQEPVLPEADKFLNVDQAAQLLGLKKGTIYQLVHKRKISYMKTGKKLLFSEKILNQWVESSRKQSDQEIQSEAIKSLSADISDGGK